jgi:hypothetical protein
MNRFVLLAVVATTLAGCQSSGGTDLMAAYLANRQPYYPQQQSFAPTQMLSQQCSYRQMGGQVVQQCW